MQEAEKMSASSSGGELTLQAGQVAADGRLVCDNTALKSTGTKGI